MAKYTYEIERFENGEKLRGCVETHKTGAMCAVEIMAAVVDEIYQKCLAMGEITEIKTTITREGYFLAYANGAQDRIFAKVRKQDDG